ncbi:MAG: hypothetical protein FJX80_03230 [Bacteroidetes bacterium]|nr:hypothetical protein [Bacteroidota bacterium]
MIKKNKNKTHAKAKRGAKSKTTRRSKKGGRAFVGQSWMPPKHNIPVVPSSESNFFKLNKYGNVVGGVEVAVPANHGPGSNDHAKLNVPISNSRLGSGGGKKKFRGGSQGGVALGGFADTFTNIFNNGANKLFNAVSRYNGYPDSISPSPWVQPLGNTYYSRNVVYPNLQNYGPR